MIYRILVATLMFAAVNLTFNARESAPGSQRPTGELSSLPFELVYDHILIKVNINNRGPFWFLLDTGNTVAIVDLDVAKSLGLELGAPVSVAGGGAGMLEGAAVRNSYFQVPGIPGFRQRISLAIPLNAVKHRFGHDIDGLLGADFIGNFVVEIDYYSKLIRLYDTDRFVYAGSGQSVPIILSAGNRPLVHCEMVQGGRDPIPGMFVIDLGSGLALTLTRQFVQENRLLQSNLPTVDATIGVGAGGKARALVGRAAALKLGAFTITNPITNFSLDTAGALATNAYFEGNIGAQIMSKFKVILDYRNKRMILEPNPTFPEPLEFDMSGMNLVADGSEYKTFRVVELIEHGPAAEAGVRIGDVIVAIDTRSAARFTLSEIRQLSAKPGVHILSIKRGNNEFKLKVEFRRLV